MGYAVTLNEPQLNELLTWVMPDFVWDKNRKCLNALATRLGVEKYSSGNVMDRDDIPRAREHLLKAHGLAREAIKGQRPELPVGVSIAIEDDQAVGSTVVRDRKRAEVYQPWLEIARDDDYLGVQNYARRRYDANGKLPPPADAIIGDMDQEVYPPALGNTTRYAYEQAQVPILITEHGVGTSDDSVRANLIPAALKGLKSAMTDGVPVLGYLHWSLMDNFEWVFGYGPKFGLTSINRETFERTPKPSAKVLGGIATRNAL
jgi:beta-glucosidase